MSTGDELEALLRPPAIEMPPYPPKVITLASGEQMVVRQIRYLAYARVENDELSVEHLGPGAVENPQVRDNRDPHAAERNAIVKTRRQVTVTMEIYDLERGGIVWSATVRRQRDELYDFNAASADRKPDVVPQGEPVITATGRAVPSPEFTQVFADACGALADRLLPAAKP